MEFTYTARQRELKERAAQLTKTIMQYEEECEENNGLPHEAHADIRRAVLDVGLQAINMPTEWGGAGLSVLEQVVVQEELGRLTNALWDTVWRPANALRACTPEQRERYLLPGIRGERRDAVAVTEPEAGSDPQRISTTARKDGDGYVINGEKWFVTVGDVADFIILLAGGRGRPHLVPRRQGPAGGGDHPDPEVHAHLRLRAPGDDVHRRRVGADACSVRSGRATS